MGHHGSLGGCVRVYCGDGVGAAEVARFAAAVAGVATVLERREAAARFELPWDVEGDVVVISDARHAIGMRRGDHDLAGLHGARLRTHGGISEQEVPFIINRPLSAAFHARAAAQQLKNYQVFEFATNGTVAPL